MNIIAIGILPLLLASAPVAQAVAQPAPETSLTGEQAIEDVALLEQALSELHPGWGRYTSEQHMSLLFDELKNSARSGMTDLELHRRVSRVTAAMRCDHTLAEVPSSIVKWRSQHATHPPFRLKIVEGRAIVDQIGDAADELRRGDELLRINGRSFASLVESVEPLIAVDGFTDWAKRPVVEYSSELPSGAIDSFWPAMYGYADSFEVDVQRADGTSETLHLDAVTYPEYVKIATGSAQRYSSNFEDAVSFEIVDGSTGLLTIGTFVNYRTNADPVAIFAPVFQELKKQGAQRLVIDLRACGGGSDEVPDTLMSYLVEEPFRVLRSQPLVRAYRFDSLREHLSTWDERIFSLPAELFTPSGDGFFEVGEALMPNTLIEPRADRFDGEVVVLCGPANASGATNFMARLQNRADVTFVGEPTGGSSEGCTAGMILMLTLPNSDIVVRLPLLLQPNNVARFDPGRGIMPDRLVAEKVEGVRAGQDAVLRALGIDR